MTTETIRVTFRHLPDNDFGRSRGIIHFYGPVSVESSTKIKEYVEATFDYFGYETVEIKIASPGGDSGAMYDLIECLETYNSKGKTIITNSLSSTASAGAFILSSGSIGYRTASKNSRILYHYSRTKIENYITTEIAKQISESLETTDDTIKKQMVRKAINTLKDTVALKEKINRFLKSAEDMDILDSDDPFSGYKNINHNNFDQHLDKLEKTIGSVFDRLFKMELWLNAQEAVDLLLIDRLGA